MAGRGGRLISGQGKSPRTAVTSRSSRFLSNSTTTMEHILGVGSTFSGLTSSSDKTVCQYCGVSYLTMSEMRSLQTTVKDQEERLSHYKNMMQENVRLKDALANIRKTHIAELMKQEEQTQRVSNQNESLQNQIELLKKEFNVNKQKHMDLQQKYTISSEDARHQEEVISQLRDTVQERGDSLAENLTLNNKVKTLETTLQKVLVQFREVAGNNNIINEQKSSSQHETQSYGPDMGDHVRSNKNGQDVRAEQAEWGNWRGQQKSYNNNNQLQENGRPKVSSLASIETHDLKRQIALVNEKLRALTEEHSNCPDMHAFLRQTVDKLKVDNMKLHENMNCLKVKYEENVMEYSNLEAKLEGVQGENLRMKDIGRQMEEHIRFVNEQNKAIKKSHDPKLVEHLQKTVFGLQHQFEQQKLEIEELNKEFENKLNDGQRETAMEKERADSCLASSLSEREGVEKRWEERWDRHQISLNEQIESLKSNHEETIRKTKEHEIALQKDLNGLNGKFEKSKEAWESYRKTLQDQISQWKLKYEQKHRDLESTRKCKVEVELLFQDKNKELEMLHEMVRDGCEERQELQKKVENLEESLEEANNHGTTMKRFYTSHNNNPTIYNKNQKVPNEGYLHGGVGIGVIGNKPIGSPLKYSSSECILSSCTVSNSDYSSYNSVGMDGNPPDSSHRVSDLSSISTSIPSTSQFTVGKGKKPSTSNTIQGKDKNSNKIGQHQQQQQQQQQHQKTLNLQNNNVSGSGGGGGTSTNLPSRKSNK